MMIVWLNYTRLYIIILIFNHIILYTWHVPTMRGKGKVWLHTPGPVSKFDFQLNSNEAIYDLCGKRASAQRSNIDLYFAISSTEWWCRTSSFWCFLWQEKWHIGESGGLTVFMLVFLAMLLRLVFVVVPTESAFAMCFGSFEQLMQRSNRLRKEFKFIDRQRRYGLKVIRSSLIF